MTNFKKLKTELKSKTELYTHYKELYYTSLGELKFEKAQVDFLVNSLREIEKLAEQKVNPILISKVINNNLEKHYYNKLIHTDLIFK
jgi:hypothetical protein